MLSRLLSSFKTQYSVTDPGFLQGGGANPPGGDANIGFCQFSQKPHEIERIWTGGASPAPPLDPPLIFSPRKVKNHNKRQYM